MRGVPFLISNYPDIWLFLYLGRCFGFCISFEQAMKRVLAMLTKGSTLYNIDNCCGAQVPVLVCCAIFGRFSLLLPTDASISPAEFQAELAPWRSPLSRSLHRNRAQAFCRFLQLATVRENGAPANRTVVFRGFLEGCNQLMFISDRRSEKTAQIQQNPNVEACWYFTKTREQFRISGRLAVVTEETELPILAIARQQLWQKISDNARLQFAWPHPKESRSETANFSPSAPDAQTPLSTFCLLLLDPRSVDWLSLRGEPQNRKVYTRVDAAEGWKVADVNP